jgi:hypothetical protein
MPHEFWREVVDRVAAEVPGTLLLAEAFWLMEGYFVRTLGMHRVYNSAFMVMLRDEENAKYRSVIKNTLEFDPDIMKRYVNFMSNPDERTAIDQFGKGDKCFGVAAMMATLPGLPMFGHGQIEGFTEKYGMEYQRPRYDETPDPWMVERHEREIAPLLKLRWLFAESSNFLLYDFFQDNGKVNENVFAYSNRSGSERALIVFNNSYNSTHGTIDYSAAYADKASAQLRQQRLKEGLGVNAELALVLAWRDSLTGLEYLRRANDLEERGLTLNLSAYQCHVFLNWRELTSTAEQPWDRLSDCLNGQGVPNLDDALVNLELRPVHDALRQLLDPALVRQFAALAEQPHTVATRANRTTGQERSEFFDRSWSRCERFLRAAQDAYPARVQKEGEPASALPTAPRLLGPVFHERLRAALRLPIVEELFSTPWTEAARRILPSFSPQHTATALWGPLLGWSALQLLAESIDAESPERVALELFDRLRLREPFAHAFNALGFEGEDGWRAAARIKVVLLTGAGIGSGASITEQEVGISQQEEANTVKGTGFSPYINAINSAGALAPEGEFSKISPTIETISAQPEAIDERVSLAHILWLDPDVRWLTGIHEDEGHAYLVREPYEELLWWLLMPSLLRLASEAAPSRAAIEQMSRTVEEALETAEAANYRIGAMLIAVASPEANKEPVVEVESPAAEPEPAPNESNEPQAEEVGLRESISESAAAEPESEDL